MKKIIFLIIFFFSNAKAVTINDYEIEKFVVDIIKYTYDKNNNLDFSIILNDNPNAFINEDNKIFITTGLLKYANTVEAFIGVIAHEIGHIKFYHINKRKQSVGSLKLINQLGSLSAVASSIITKNPDILMQSTIAGSVGIQNYYSTFSKDQEREADIYAIEKLNELNISSEYLSNFLHYLENDFYKKGISDDFQKFSTHPNYKERIGIIQNNKKKVVEKKEHKFQTRYDYIKAKLIGYTEKNIGNIDAFIQNKNSQNYGKAIMLSKEGKLLDSLLLLNDLIKKFPDNEFFLETKADILYNHSYTNEAEKFYKLSFIKNEKNFYVKKRLFEISYNKLDYNDNVSVNEFFETYKDLVFFNSNNLVFLEKWKTIFKFLNKKNWSLYLDFKMDLLEGNKSDALKKINYILDNSNDKLLKKYSKKQRMKLTNE